MTVWVVGNTVWDTLLPVETLPVRGETVLAQHVSRTPGGKGANQALVARRFGADVRFVTALGTDHGGVELGRALAQAGLSRIRAVRTDTPTDESWVVTEESGENVIISTNCAIAALDGPAICTALDAAVPGDLLVMQGNTTPAATQTALRHGRSRGMVTVFSPAPAQAGFTGCWPFCDLVILNQSEAATLLDAADSGAALSALTGAGAGAAVLTLGADGACHRTAAGQTGQVAGHRVTAVDTSGAGDTLAGALVAGLASGLALPRALEMAMAAAALTVTRPGTFAAFPTVGEAGRLLAGAQAAAAGKQNHAGAR